MRILLVEDESKLNALIKRGLEKHGFAVDVIENGSEAVEHIILNNADYDAVVLDLMLPGRSGHDICTTIRERGIQLPILVLTAKQLTSDKIVLLNMGADDYMTKPFELAELVARLRALMRRPNESLPTEYVVGSLRLNPSTRRVFVEEVPLDLTRKEFALLELFMQHPGKALEREYIHDHVWDFNFNSLSNVVDVHVKNLRKKLGQSNEKVFIETVDGVGYRFETEA